PIIFGNTCATSLPMADKESNAIFFQLLIVSIVDVYLYSVVDRFQFSPSVLKSFRRALPKLMENKEAMSMTNFAAAMSFMIFFFMPGGASLSEASSSLNGFLCCSAIYSWVL